MRRDFLKFCGQAGLGLAIPVGWSATCLQGKVEGTRSPTKGPYYVTFNASGGWDTTCLMDPKGVNGINRLYKEDDILTQGKHVFAPTAKQVEKGMSNEDFFKAYGNDLLVINGLDYSINNHSPCKRYMATGKLDSLAYPTFAALAAACRGPETPLAFLTFGNYSATGNLVPMARIPYLPSLKLIANADSVQGVARNLYHDDFALDLIEKALSGTSRSLPPMAHPQLPRAERDPKHALRRPNEFQGPQASHSIHKRQYPPGDVWRNKLRSPCPASRAGSVFRPTYPSANSTVTPPTIPTR